MTARDDRNLTTGHEVLIYDEDAKALAHLYLPPEGTQVSIEELEAALARLAEAARERKRRRGDDGDCFYFSRPLDGSE